VGAAPLPPFREFFPSLLAFFLTFAINLPVEEFQKRILAAQGYHELGLWREAWRELDGLSDALQHRPDIVEMRVLILINESKWREGLTLSRRLAEIAPQEDGGWVHAAYCLHALGRTREAIQTLLSAPASLREKAIFHYNFACYSCVLGQIDAARESLQRSIVLDKRYRDYARSDHDLKPLHPELR
jgi:tetratricopeptide (TPR) repeat protein